ncbi:molybdopterin oxidoreductase [Candidatus Bathyarchaeota archaeon ex4484_205]|nr:MAG: molybdopterin oxidoreductase [Candidatus Bathyarchaeota archaeon ex4484_205]
MERKIICIVCPVGCEITVREKSDGEILVEGFRCPRGKEYALREITNPMRVLFTVLRVRGGELPTVSVKSSKPIPKKLIKEAVKKLSYMEVDAPIEVGDRLLENFMGTGADIIATRKVEKRLKDL